MVDPVGAPTFAQMFSPMKSPFHALGLSALVCLLAIFQSDLARFGTGFALTILIVATVLAPLFRPVYKDRTYGLSLMFARAAGLIGAMLAIGILISFSGLDSQEKFDAHSNMFGFLRAIILLQAAYMGSLFFFKTTPIVGEEKRFNIIQFSLMQSTLLAFIVGMSVAAKSFHYYFITDIFAYGFVTLIGAPVQLFTNWKMAPDVVIYSLIALWATSGVVNAILLAPYLKSGWIGDHGEGVSN